MDFPAQPRTSVGIPRSGVPKVYPRSSGPKAAWLGGLCMRVVHFAAFRERYLVVGLGDRHGRCMKDFNA